MIEIKNRYTNAAIYRSDTATTVREAVKDAVNAGANLSDADLSYAYLVGAYLVGADLGGADLGGADLGGANLGGADLGGANLGSANLGSANLGSANLADADLSYANLGSANLSGADLGGFNAPSIPDIDAAILAAIENGGTLEMGEWHTCETTHCRAGWAIHLAGDAGRALETRIGPSAAGALIYAASGSHPVPYWHAANAKAMADLRERAARSNAAIEGAQ